MLFPNDDQLTSTWRTVCEGVATDTLGTAAKVGVHDPLQPGKPRLICVYTRDFSDLVDVRRVLDELVDLGLCPREGNGIYYKCDAYTYLGIESNNVFKLRASLYSSREMLKMTKTTVKKTKAGDSEKGTSKKGRLEGWLF